ncbi:hypothetical protein GVAV_002717 [Gurleya vavrai]
MTEKEIVQFINKDLPKIVDDLKNYRKESKKKQKHENAKKLNQSTNYNHIAKEKSENIRKNKHDETSNENTTSSIIDTENSNGTESLNLIIGNGRYTPKEKDYVQIVQNVLKKNCWNSTLKKNFLINVKNLQETGIFEKKINEIYTIIKNYDFKANKDNTTDFLIVIITDISNLILSIKGEDKNFFIDLLVKERILNYENWSCYLKARPNNNLLFENVLKQVFDLNKMFIPKFYNSIFLVRNEKICVKEHIEEKFLTFYNFINTEKISTILADLFDVKKCKEEILLTKHFLDVIKNSKQFDSKNSYLINFWTRVENDFNDIDIIATNSIYIEDYLLVFYLRTNYMFFNIKFSTYCIYKMNFAYPEVIKQLQNNRLIIEILNKFDNDTKIFLLDISLHKILDATNLALTDFLVRGKNLEYNVDNFVNNEGYKFFKDSIYFLTSFFMKLKKIEKTISKKQTKKII